MKSKTNTKEKSDVITRTESFAGTIARKDGKKTLVLNSPKWYHHQLNRFKDGEKVTLEIHSKKPKRTEAQNRYLWGVYYPLVAEALGETNLQKLHQFLKGEFLTESIEDVVDERTGKVIGKVRIEKSTTELSKAEFSEYIMRIEAEHGVPAPPTENYDLAPLMHEEYEAGHR